MAFSLVATYQVTNTTNLTNGSPFRLGGAEGVNSPPVMRLEQSGPLQHGATDLGFRLGPRTLTLNIYFYAATATLLDTYRQTLHSTFRPTQTTTLLLTRDDGALRYLRVVRVDDIAIDLVPENRPGNLHRAVVRLRAASPAWYDAGVVDTFGGTAQVWWTAGGYIDAANVMEHVELPTNGQAWTYAGTITTTWTVVFRSGQEANSGTHTAFHAGTGALQTASTHDARLYYSPLNSVWDYETGFTALDTMPAGTKNYMVVHDISGVIGLTTLYYDADTFYTVAIAPDYDISGTARRWRSDRLGSVSTYWTNEFPKAAVYNKALTSGERIALDGWMSGTAMSGSLTSVNSGDLEEYPFITIQGPIVNPILTNVTTGVVLDFTGVTLGSADVYRIDLRTGDKTVTDVSGSSVIANIVSPAALARWNLAPAPIAAGGTNTISVTGGSITTNTNVTITHYNRYLSY